MMGELFVALMLFAVWLNPDDPATLFMWLVIGGTTLVLAAVFLVVGAIDRRRERLQLTTDWTDDPTTLGDHVEVPRR